MLSSNNAHTLNRLFHKPSSRVILLLWWFGVCLFLFTKVNAQSWTKLAGSSATEGGRSIDVGSNGDVYASGLIAGYSDFGDTIINISGSGFFIIKYDASGTFQWINVIRAGNIYDAGITLDDSENVYFGGAFLDTLFIGADTLVGNTDGLLKHKPFVAKYNRNGVYQWVRTPVMKSVDGEFFPYAIGVSMIGNIYFSGDCDAMFFPCDTLVFGNDTLYEDFFVKYNPNGNVIWTKQEKVQHIAFDRMGNYYVAFGPWVKKYNAADALTWFFNVGDSITGLDADSIGNVYVSKYNFIVSKYDSSGAFLWQTSFNADKIHAITSDNTGTILVAYMNFYSDSNKTTIEKYSSSGNYIGGMTFGLRADKTPASVEIMDMYLDENGFIYAVGSCFVPPSGVIFGYDTLIGYGGVDILISKLSSGFLVNSINYIYFNNHPFYVYPNPFNEVIKIAVSNGDARELVKIYIADYMGKIIHSKMTTLTKGLNTIHLGISSLAPGLYLLQIQTNTNNYTHKIIKL